ncbi:MAG: ABC transporter ATP-binding protein [Desulfobacteraceae bacterium]|nr:MAG: ABC transporter ATP-binding protein [Desulfobacteraceae bacterium]
MLTVEDLSFSYREKPILSEIAFKVQSGVIHGLLGPNASGKTTLLKLLNGLLQPQQGRVLTDGRVVARLSRKEIAGFMAMVPQQTTVVFAFSVLQMVIMARAAKLGMLGVPSGQDYTEARLALKDLGAEHLADRRFNELSGGERQMVLLARALFQDPRILLLDEPTAHLDFKNQFLILDKIREVTRRKHLATLITLHDPNLAARYCDRMILLKAGRVLGDGPGETVFTPAMLEAVYDLKVRIEHTAENGKMVIPVR